MVLLTIIRRFFRWLSLKSAVRTAKQMHALTRRKQYVLQVNGRTRVYNRIKINMLIDMGILSKKLRDARELEKFSMYFTGQPKPAKGKILK
jgi:hypothetical protein